MSKVQLIITELWNNINNNLRNDNHILFMWIQCEQKPLDVSNKILHNNNQYYPILSLGSSKDIFGVIFLADNYL